MVQAQMMEGTTEEIMTRLLESFPGQKLRVFVEPEEDLEEALGSSLPDPPNAVRDEAHLIALLHSGLNSPMQEVTDETWEQKRQEVHQRHAARQR